MVNNFKTDLVLHVARSPREEILRRMGYAKPTSANLEGLENVLQSSSFGLDDGGFDFKYSSEGFLRALWVDAGFKRKTQSLFGTGCLRAPAVSAFRQRVLEVSDRQAAGS